MLVEDRKQRLWWFYKKKDKTSFPSVIEYFVRIPSDLPSYPRVGSKSLDPTCLIDSFS